MLEHGQKDYLTGFFTREALNSFLAELITESLSKKKRFSLALIDLERFKKFNDRYGHAFGDEVLKYATSTLRLTFLESACYLFRYGGDEFIAVIPDKDPREAFRLLRQCGHNLARRPFLFANKCYKITASCGIAVFPADGKNAEELIKKADEAMYFSKRHGRNLTTLAGRIRFLKFRNALLIVTSSVLILCSFYIYYQQSFKKVIQPTVDQMQYLRIITKPANLDTIVLKSGVVFEGRIISEAEGKVVVSLYMEKGEGSAVFDRSEIAEIKYGNRR